MRFFTYKAMSLFPSQRYRWKIMGDNNKIVCASSEGFYTHAHALENARLTRDGLVAFDIDGFSTNRKVESPL